MISLLKFSIWIVQTILILSPVILHVDAFILVPQDPKVEAKSLDNIPNISQMGYQSKLALSFSHAW